MYRHYFTKKRFADLATLCPSYILFLFRKSRALEKHRVKLFSQCPYTPIFKVAHLRIEVALQIIFYWNKLDKVGSAQLSHQ